MIEKYLEAGRKVGAIWGGRMLRRMAFIPAQIWIIILVILLVGARPVWTFIQRPAHLNEIAAECGSSLVSFWGLPTANRDGTKIAYAQTTENGLGIFVNDLTTGKSQLIHEYKEPDVLPGMELFTMLPWSPDDSFFGYTVNQPGLKQEADQLQQIVFCDAKTGAETIVASFRGQFWCPTPDSCFSWLSSHSFLYVNHWNELHLVQKQMDGTWKDTVRLDPSQMGEAPASFITVLSDNHIVWSQGKALWQLDALSSSPPVKYFDLSTNVPDLEKITRASYSPETGRFLLNCLSSNNVATCWQLTPTNSSSENLTQIQPDHATWGGKWIKQGNGWAYVSQSEPQHDTLVIQTNFSTTSTTLIKFSADLSSYYSQGFTLSFTPAANGKRLFIPGIFNDEIVPSVWEYELGSSSLRSVVPVPKCPLLRARDNNLLRQTMTLPSGSTTGYQIQFPPDFDRHQKRRYPVMIANQYMDAYASAFADCGVIYVTVGSGAHEDGAKEEQWERDLWEFYKYLAGTPYVDTRRIFLGAACAETGGLSKFLLTHPSPWKGIILMDFIQPPDLTVLAQGEHPPKILLSAGSQNGESESVRLCNYQAEACKLGIKVEFSLLVGTGHPYISQRSIRERLESVMNFIYDN
jgi:hypothetical protein